LQAVQASTSAANVDQSSVAMRVRRASASSPPAPARERSLLARGERRRRGFRREIGHRHVGLPLRRVAQTGRERNRHCGNKPSSASRSSRVLARSR
jgi:hypothetical protein